MIQSVQLKNYSASENSISAASISLISSSKLIIVVIGTLTILRSSILLSHPLSSSCYTCILWSDFLQWASSLLHWAFSCALDLLPSFSSEWIYSFKIIWFAMTIFILRSDFFERLPLIWTMSRAWAGRWGEDWRGRLMCGSGCSWLFEHSSVMCSRAGQWAVSFFNDIVLLFRFVR